MRHRNTRRRPYRPFGYYFITTNVRKGFHILDTNVFGFLAEHILHLSARQHDVNLIAYKLNPDHVHLLCQIGRAGTISAYMGSWKRQFSRQTNEILFREMHRRANLAGGDSVVFPGWDSNPGQGWSNEFNWQLSYHSHLICSKRDYDAHINYIINQQRHHGLAENKFCYADRQHKFTFV